MAIGLVRFRSPPPDAAARIAPGVRLTPCADYLMWAVMAQADRFAMGDKALHDAAPAELHRAAADMTRRWHGSLRALIERADIDETFLVRVRSAADVVPWPSSRVTLLGDAIHAMSPARGSGANIALQDAATLSRELVAWGRGERELGPSLHAYEATMLERGFAAVHASSPTP